MYKAGVAEHREEWNRKTSRQKLLAGDNSAYARFKERVFVCEFTSLAYKHTIDLLTTFGDVQEVQNPGKAMLPMTEYIEAGTSSS